MDRLYIVSRTEETGGALGFRLALSSPQYKVITKLEDLENLPEKAVFVSDDSNPAPDSVKITEILRSRRFVYLKNEQYLLDVIGGIYSDLQLVNGLFDAFRSEESTKQGIRQLTEKLVGRGFTDINGLGFTITRHPKGYFVIHGKTPLMKVFVNLLIGFVNNFNKRSEIPKFQPGKPLMIL